MPFANIAVPVPLNSTFTYSIPDGFSLSEGMRVLVPFGRRNVVGICFDVFSEAPKKIDPASMKDVKEVLDGVSIVSAHLIKLIRWISQYYCAPIGEVCRAALPSRLMRVDGPVTTRPHKPLEMHALHEAGFELTAEQKNILGTIIASAKEKKPATFLLQGITGSGKTEVYLRLFEFLIASGQRGLLLVPEIGLTPQLTGRVVARFGERVAVYHSGLTDAQRHKQWMKIKAGEVDVIIGTRSALFAPIENLGAIVVDEEHDSSFKQDDGVTYHGRDVAVMRAHIEGVPIILGSATPSMESLANARSGKYRHLFLNSRPGAANLPNVEIVDMRIKKDKKRRELVSLSSELYDAIGKSISRNEQVLLYVGRRGFASSLQCGACGDVFTCPNCDISLTLHQGRVSRMRNSFETGGPEKNILTCHYCDYRIPVPNACSGCGREALIPTGHGTERLEAEIADFFPNARVARFDSDAIDSGEKRRKILDDIRAHKVDILVGTQMVTKGHDFPKITLVGVVDADQSLALPDFRAAERTFQLLTQVGGRAGRGNMAGRVIIQTRQPEHISLIATRDHDLGLFADEELKFRQALSYPPYSRLANIRITSNNEAESRKLASFAANILEKLQKKMENKDKIAILGPAKAPIFKIRGKYRWQVLIKAPGPAVLSKVLEVFKCALDARIPSGVRLSIDVDPLNLL